MAFKSKIKWVALFVLIMSLGSLVVHLSITKFSSMGIVQYGAGLGHDFPTILGSQAIRNRRLWGSIKSLTSFQPYANPQSGYHVPSEKSNIFIYAKVFGGFEKIRSSICDLVTISRLLNATLIIPEIQECTRSKAISEKFKSFSYVFDEEQFITSLKTDVVILKRLPENLKAARKRNEFPTFSPKSSASPNFYTSEVLPVLKKVKVVGLIVNNGGCLQSILPTGMVEFQRLRCRVAFHALQFRPEIQLVGRQMVERLRKSGQPFLAYHPGLVRDKLAYHGCAELFQDVQTELIQYRRAQMIKSGILNESLSVDSHSRRENGSCPFMPEEVGLLLRAMGYPPKTIIYLAGSETFGGQRILIPLRAMFANLVDRTSLCSKTELSDLVGPEAPLHADTFQMPPLKTEKQLKDEWNRAGPRPRPLPPPPDRPVYRHEKEGWYGWIAENDTEPDPTPFNLRMQAHRLIWDALDYIVSVEADAFFPGFNSDGSGSSDFSSLVMGHRLYERAASRTYRPDRKVIANLFNLTRDDIYHPKFNWTLSVREHLNRSLREDGLIRQSLLSKPAVFLSHPLPECSCRIYAVKASDQVTAKNGRLLYGGEEECPKWMQSAQADVLKSEEIESGEDDDDVVEQPEEDEGSGSNSLLPYDEEWDPND